MQLPTKPTLIVLVGLPRSGKSTWAKLQRIPMINPDAIRLALHGHRFYEPAEPFVWACAKLSVHAAFLAGHPEVIFDATNTTRKRRDELRHERWTTVFKVFETPADECIKRAIINGDTELVAVIERMSNGYEPLYPDESHYHQNLI